jgi:hypothetical protein
MNEKGMDKGGGLKWEVIDIENENTTQAIKFCRARILGGWLVRAVWDEGMTMTFVPDMHCVWVT